MERPPIDVLIDLTGVPVETRVALGAAIGKDLRGVDHVAIAPEDYDDTCAIIIRRMELLNSDHLVSLLKQKSGAVQEAPPKGCEFLLSCVARQGRADELLGDAEAEYRRMISRLGLRPARWWYRVFVARMVIRMLPAFAMRLWVFHKMFGSGLS